jgi:hypothetical protein
MLIQRRDQIVSGGFDGFHVAWRDVPGRANQRKIFPAHDILSTLLSDNLYFWPLSEQTASLLSNSSRWPYSLTQPSCFAGLPTTSAKS